MSDKELAELLPSPCVRNCCLDEKDICLGCFRHIDEIIGWQSFEQNKREIVIQHCKKRRKSKDIK